MRKILSDKLYDEFHDFREKMLNNDNELVFDSAYMIAKIHDFHIEIDNIPITSDQIEQLMKRKNVLQDLYNISISDESSDMDTEDLLECNLSDFSYEDEYEDEEELEN